MKKVTVTAVTWLLASILCVFNQSVIAATIDEFEFARTRESIDALEFQVFISGFQTKRSIGESIRRITEFRSDLSQCVNDREKELRTTRSTLGEKFLDQLYEKSELSTEELRVKDQVESLRSEISECKLLLDKINRLDTRLDELQQSKKKEILSERNDHLLHNFKEGLPGFPAMLRQKMVYLFSPAGFERDAVRPSLLIVILAGIAAGILLWYRSKAVKLSELSEHAYSIRIFMQCRYMIRKWAIVIVPLFITIVYLRYTEGILFQESQLNKLLVLVLAFMLSLIFVRASVRWYSEFARSVLTRPIPVNGLYTRLIAASILLLMWTLLFRVPHVVGVNTPSQQLLHNLLSSAVIFSMLNLMLFMPRFCKLSRLGILARIIAIFLLCISLVYEWLGYQSASEFIWSSLLFVAISLIIFLFVEKLFRDLYDSLDSGKYDWQQKVRAALSIGSDEPIPGMVWIRLLTITLLWIGLGLMILKSIGVSDNRIAAVFIFLRDGVQIGDSQISVYNVLAGTFIFALLLLSIKLVKDSLENTYLVKSRLDPGAKEAIVTITGYVGFTIAAIIGLSIAGLKFSNLAIIAGALSVGIGFGLQNIVNNFVSGIILLFERPIRPGDWIVTGTTEGYVKRISVRSTEVQTFDRSDVIVPNSNLISAEVTNWTLRDTHGRIIIPVGVAYGSDTELVKQLLEKIPDTIPEIIKGRPMLPVKVIFKEFGDSSLNFQLRCFIYDIGYVLDVKSKLHFAIDKTFREHNIEIAFPQRDIRIRSNVPSEG
ncbi:MAG: mechanosensitive ion channel domain-containing protein [Arenicellales bacterium]